MPLTSHQLSNSLASNTTPPTPTLHTHPYTKAFHVDNAIATAIGIDVASDVTTVLVTVIAIGVANTTACALTLLLLS